MFLGLDKSKTVDYHCFEQYFVRDIKFYIKQHTRLYESVWNHKLAYLKGKGDGNGNTRNYRLTRGD